MESKFVQSGPVRLEYFEQGHGLDVVVLVHGYSTSAAIWAYTLEYMSPERFSVITLNNRGAGNSDRASADGTPFSEEDYSVETLADDLFNVANALNLDGFTLVGHSMGAATATQFALQHQNLIKGLVLINCAPLNGQDLSEGWEEKLQRDIDEGEPDPDELGFDAYHVTEEFKQAVMADISRNPVERYMGGRKSIAALKLRNRLGELRIPTLIVGTDRDRILDIDTILADYQALPEEHRHLQVYHGCGHTPIVEVPQKVGGVIERFSDMAWSLDEKKKTTFERFRI